MSVWKTNCSPKSWCHVKGCKTHSDHHMALTTGYYDFFCVEALCLILTEALSKNQTHWSAEFYFTLVNLRKMRSRICLQCSVQSRCYPDKDFSLLLQYRPHNFYLCPRPGQVPRVKQVQRYSLCMHWSACTACPAWSASGDHSSSLPLSAGYELHWLY